jgi:hypothetical protein
MAAKAAVHGEPPRFDNPHWDHELKITIMIKRRDAAHGEAQYSSASPAGLGKVRAFSRRLLQRETSR